MPSGLIYLFALTSAPVALSVLLAPLIVPLLLLLCSSKDAQGDDDDESLRGRNVHLEEIEKEMEKGLVMSKDAQGDDDDESLRGRNVHLEEIEKEMEKGLVMRLDGVGFGWILLAPLVVPLLLLLCSSKDAQGDDDDESLRGRNVHLEEIEKEMEKGLVMRRKPEEMLYGATVDMDEFVTNFKAKGQMIQQQPSPSPGGGAYDTLCTPPPASNTPTQTPPPNATSRARRPPQGHQGQAHPRRAR